MTDQLTVTLEIADLEALEDFAARLAPLLRAGDLIILTGNLGAGKTTFTQALGSRLNVKGRISSPTFVIAREHKSRGTGPNLVHVDAYRLDGQTELADLDLDSELEESITIVEWGAGMAEQLDDERLEIVLDRPDEDPESERRTVVLTGRGAPWAHRLTLLASPPQDAGAREPHVQKETKED